MYNVGDKINEWTVISDAFYAILGTTKPRKTKFHKIMCSCGMKTQKAAYLINRTNACNNCKLKNNAERKKTISGSREYITWESMKGRCYNPNNNKFKNYGARGIKVCDRWLNSFQNFLKDMGKKPSDKHSIDRVDNDGPYSPSNCVWSLPKEQSRNKTTSRKLFYKGKDRTIAEIAEMENVKYSAIMYRVMRKSLTADEIIKEIKQRNQHHDNKKTRH